MDCIALFEACHSQSLGSIKQPGLDIWKTKSLLNDQYYFFQILEAYNDLIIESLE